MPKQVHFKNNVWSYVF